MGLPPIVVLPPAQKSLSGPASATGSGFTVTLVLALSVHPSASVTITVYVVFPLGDAVGLAMVALFKPVVGVQL